MLDIVFGGTSISSIISKPELDVALDPSSYEEIADVIANNYVNAAREIQPQLSNAFSEQEIALYKEHGIFYGVHVSPKLLALAEGLVVSHEDLLLDGFPEPYVLPKQDAEVIAEYFAALKEQKGLDLDISSLVLADTTTPEGYSGKRILNPVNLNEKLKRLSELTTDAVKAQGMECDPLYFLCTDSDSPDRMMLSTGKKSLDGNPLTPGLTMCGSTAKMDGFDLTYMYRVGLITQMLSNNIIGSRMQGKFSPFTFVGMLSPFGYVNGAIPTGEMDALRYEGNMDMQKEFLYQFDKTIAKMI
jgi:hypothetical protein